MDIFDIREVALGREKNRALRIAEAMSSLPKRKSKELAQVCKQLDQAHELLIRYDLMPEPPALAGVTETWFDAALERIDEIKSQGKSQGKEG